MNNPNTVAAQIRTRLGNLTPLESKVATHILSRKDISNETSLSEVATTSGVSEAMVVKVAKKLGFAGYREFRKGLVDYNESETASLYSEISFDDDSAQIAQKVFRAAMQALEQTYAILDLSAFDKAVGFIAEAQQRDFYGLGGSAQIARDVGHKFLRLGIRTSVFDDAHMMMMSASLLTPKDVVVAFSHSGDSSAIFDAVNLARSGGARIILVTNYPNSAIAKVSDAVLCATAEDSPLLGENATARIAQLSLLDALFVAVAQRNRTAAAENLNKTINAVTLKRKG